MTLRDARKLAECSRDDIAYFTGYSRKQISRWENGYPPRIDQLLCLCEIYRISITDLDLEEWRL